MLAMALFAGMPANAHSEKAAAPAAKSKAAATPRVVALAATDAMKFDPATIQAKPGEKLHVVLKPAGTMPKIAMAHNFVILKPGSDYAAFANASATAPPTYLAPALKNQVVTSTPLAGNGEAVEADFTAPAKPGSYTFICTFPGHFASGMKGVLVVK
jgi:azurin